MNSLDQTLSALADAHRRGVVDLLRERPRRAGELSDALGLSPPALSRHLRVLRRTGLIGEESVEDDARIRMFHLRRERFAELREWLTEVEGFWGDQLAAFEQHVAKRKKRRHS